MTPQVRMMTPHAPASRDRIAPSSASSRTRGKIPDTISKPYDDKTFQAVKLRDFDQALLQSVIAQALSEKLLGSSSSSVLVVNKVTKK